MMPQKQQQHDSVLHAVVATRTASTFLPCAVAATKAADTRFGCLRLAPRASRLALLLPQKQQQHDSALRASLCCCHKNGIGVALSISLLPPRKQQIHNSVFFPCAVAAFEEAATQFGCLCLALCAVAATISAATWFGPLRISLLPPQKQQQYHLVLCGLRCCCCCCCCCYNISSNMVWSLAPCAVPT